MAARKQFKIIISAVDKATRPLKKVQRQIQAIGKSMRKTGRALSVKLSAPIIAFGGFAIRASMNFEAAMNRVRAITGATGDDFKRLNDQAKLLGRTTQFSASQAAQAMGFLAQAGFKVNEITDVMPGTLELAASAQLELGEAANIVSNILRGYGLEVSELGRVNDVLVKAFTSANTNLFDLGESMKFGGPIAAQMGLSFEETAAALAQFATAGFQGSEGGTKFRKVLSSLASPSAKTMKALVKLGIPLSKLTDRKGNLRSFVTLLKELELGGAGVSDMLNLFGERAGPALGAVLKLGVGELENLKEALLDAGGTAANIAAIQMEGATGATLKFKSAIEGLQIAIGEAGLLQSFTKITEALTKFTQSMSESNPVALKWGTTLAVIAAATGPILIGIGLMATGWAALAPKIAVIAAVAAKLGAVLVAALGLPLWGVTLAIAGVVAAGLLLVKFWDPIVKFLSKIGDAILSPFIKFAEFTGRATDFFGSSGVVPELAGATAGGGSLPVAPPARTEVNGKVGVVVKLESDVPARVTELSAEGDAEIDVDSGPVMSGL